MCAEAHLIFFEAENFKIFQIHFVHCVEFGGELLGRTINMSIIHVERADAHQAEQFARLFIAIAGTIFRKAQRQITITVRFGRKDAVAL